MLSFLIAIRSELPVRKDQKSMFEPVLRHLMVGLLAASILLVSGCLVSEKPLVVVGDLPFAIGSKFTPYNDGSEAYVEASEYSVKTLAIRDGWYVYANPDGSESSFKLHQIDADSWIIMIPINRGSFSYGWMRREGDLYVVYPGDADQLRHWKGQIDLNTGWQGQQGNVQVLSLNYLVRIMPGALAAHAHGKPKAFKFADAATLRAGTLIVTPQMMETMRKSAAAKVENLNEQIRRNEEQQKQLKAKINGNAVQSESCGGQACIDDAGSLAGPAPFSQFSMGEYLDAIYNGDIARVRQLDDAYLGQQIRQLQEGMSSLGPLGKMMTGAMQLNSATLVNPAIRAYGSSYDYIYGKCLREDSVSVVTTRTNVDTGETIEGETFPMNREFAQPFMDIYSEPSAGDLAEPLANIVKGVHQVMRTYACNDPVIKRFERRLLEMYSTRKADR
jgi:hypothetical protein